MLDVINAINASDGSFQNTVTEICEYDNNLCAKFGMTMYVVALYVVGTHEAAEPGHMWHLYQLQLGYQILLDSSVDLM